MKIALISDRIYPFFSGGYETLLNKVIHYLSASHEVTVFTTWNTLDHSGFLNKVKVISISKENNYTNKKGQHNLSGTITYMLSLLASVNKIRGFDLVLVSTIPYLGMSIVINRLSKANKKVVSIFYEAWYDYSPTRRFRLLSGKILRHEIGEIVAASSSVLSISNPTTLSLEQHYRAKKIVTMPMGIELEMIKRVNKTQLDVDISFLGRIVTIKRIQDLIRAILLLKKNGLYIKTVIIGDGPALSFLKRMSENEGVSDLITFLGKVSDEEKYTLLKSSKLFVLPSEREGFSIATLEAMACGCVPIVAVPNYPEIFGVSHFVKNTINGIYYELGNVSMLASEIKSILSNRTILESMSKNATETAGMYRWNIVLQNLRVLTN